MIVVLSKQREWVFGAIVSNQMFSKRIEFLCAVHKRFANIEYAFLRNRTTKFPNQRIFSKHHRVAAQIVPLHLSSW
eukprot:jgi/Antlo1/1702/991